MYYVIFKAVPILKSIVSEAILIERNVHIDLDYSYFYKLLITFALTRT